MKRHAIALVLGVLCAAAQGQQLDYRIELSYPGTAASSYDLTTVVGTKASLQNITTQTIIGEINSNFGEVTRVPTERASGLTASVTPQEVAKDGKVLTSLTYTIWNKGLQASKGTHVVQLKPGDKVALPAFDGQSLAITLLK